MMSGLERIAMDTNEILAVVGGLILAATTLIPAEIKGLSRRKRVAIFVVAVVLVGSAIGYAHLSSPREASQPNGQPSQNPTTKNTMGNITNNSGTVTQGQTGDNSK
jgi:hypothetical protein